MGVVGGFVPAGVEPSEDGGWGWDRGLGCATYSILDEGMLEPGDGIVPVRVGSEVGGVFFRSGHGVVGPLVCDVVGFGEVQGAGGFGEFAGVEDAGVEPGRGGGGAFSGEGGVQGGGAVGAGPGVSWVEAGLAEVVDGGPVAGVGWVVFEEDEGVVSVIGEGSGGGAAGGLVGFGFEFGVGGVGVDDGVGCSVGEGSLEGGGEVGVGGVGAVGVELEFVEAQVEGLAGEVGEFDGFVVEVAFDVFGDEEVACAGDGGVGLNPSAWCQEGEARGGEEDCREGEGEGGGFVFVPGGGFVGVWCGLFCGGFGVVVVVVLGHGVVVLLLLLFSFFFCFLFFCSALLFFCVFFSSVLLSVLFSVLLFCSLCFVSGCIVVLVDGCRGVVDGCRGVVDDGVGCWFVL